MHYLYQHLYIQIANTVEIEFRLIEHRFFSSDFGLGTNKEIRDAPHAVLT